MASHGESGQRLDRVVATRLPDLSRTRVQELVQASLILVDGRAAKGSLRLRGGEQISVQIRPRPPIRAEAESIPLDILYEDDDVIAVNKPAGMIVHAGAGTHSGTLVNALLGRGQTLSQGGDALRPGIVHRLDKDTSGLLVVAKTELAHRALSRDFAGRRIERAYSGFVWGVPAPSAGEISGNIGRSPRNRKKMAVLPEGRGRSAVTRYRVERRYADHAALIECRLLTGRTHQIRVHLAHGGHPLIGDPVYGTRAGRAVARFGAPGAAISAFPRQALHARLLGFAHPAAGEKLRFESPLPADLAELKRNLELL